MRIRGIGVGLCVLAVWLTGGTAAAGVVIEMEQRQPSSNAVMARAVFYLDAGRLRIEAQGEAGEDMVVIFRAEESVAWSIDRKEGTYYEFTLAEATRLSSQMEKARQQMEAQMGEMSPEERRMLEQMMGQRMGAPAPISVRVVGRGEQMGGFTCTRYEVLRGGARSAEVWTAPPEQLQIRPEEFDTLGALARLFEPLRQAAPLGARGGLSALPEGSNKMEGFPVRTLTYDEGRPVAEERVVRSARQSLAASLFELPSGLRKTSLRERR